MSDMITLSVNLPESVVETLRKVAEQEHTTMTEALLRAINTEAYFQKARSQNVKVLLETRDGRFREVVFPD